MSFMTSNPVTYSATHMALADFLGLTAFVASVIGMAFTSLDSVIIITTPQMTMLDYILVIVIFEEVWDLWDYFTSIGR